MRTSEGRSGRRREPADPLGLLALAGAGAMMAHQIGYLFASTSSPVVVSHSYFSIAIPALILALCGAGWGASVRILRRGGGRRPSLWQLAIGQAAVFVAMEFGEHAAAGAIQGMVSAPVLIGFALQLPIAWLALRLLHVGNAVLQRLFAGEPTAQHVAVPLAIVPFIQEVRDQQRRNSLRVRGPPTI